DASGNNRAATLSGTYSRVPGQLGHAVKLSGSTSRARTSGPVLNTNQSWTVAGWVRLDSSDRDQAVWSQMGTNNPAFSLYYAVSNAPEFDQHWLLSLAAQDNPDAYRDTLIQSKNLAKVGQWTHLATSTTHPPARCGSTSMANCPPSGTSASAGTPAAPSSSATDSPTASTPTTPASTAPSTTSTSTSEC